MLKMLSAISRRQGPMERSVYMSDHRIVTALRYVEKAKELAAQ